jgi:hypothetical protein
MSLIALMTVVYAAVIFFLFILVFISIMYIYYLIYHLIYWSQNYLSTHGLIPLKAVLFYLCNGHIVFLVCSTYWTLTRHYIYGILLHWYFYKPNGSFPLWRRDTTTARILFELFLLFKCFNFSESTKLLWDLWVASHHCGPNGSWVRSLIPSLATRVFLRFSSLLEKSTFLNSNSISGVRPRRDLESIVYSPGLSSFIKEKQP